MVFRFLLHDSSDMSIGGVSGKRKFGIWSEVLEWHRALPPGGALFAGKPPERRQSIAKSLPPPLFRGQSKVLGLKHSWAKNSGKSLPCQESFAVV
jgi:hypothetical protein